MIAELKRNASRNISWRHSKKEKPKEMVYIEYGLELFPKLIEQEEILAYEVKKRFYQIGSPEGLAEFEEYVSQVGIVL